MGEYEKDKRDELRAQELKQAFRKGVDVQNGYLSFTDQKGAPRSATSEEVSQYPEYYSHLREDPGFEMGTGSRVGGAFSEKIEPTLQKRNYEMEAVKRLEGEDRGIVRPSSPYEEAWSQGEEESAFIIDNDAPEHFDAGIEEYNNRIWNAYTAQTPAQWRQAVEEYDDGFPDMVFQDDDEVEAELLNRVSKLSGDMHEAEWEQSRDWFPGTMEKEQAKTYRQDTLQWKRIVDGRDGEDSDIPNFIKRINSPENYPYITNQDGSNTTHLMSAEDDADGNWFVFPTVVLKEDGTLHHFKNNREAMAYNMKRNNYKSFGKDKQGAFDYSAGGYKTDKFRNFYKELERKKDQEVTSSPGNNKDNENVADVVYKDKKEAEFSKGASAGYHDARKVKEPKKKLKPKPKGSKK